MLLNYIHCKVENLQSVFRVYLQGKLASKQCDEQLQPSPRNCSAYSPQLQPPAHATLSSQKRATQYKLIGNHY